MTIRGRVIKGEQKAGRYYGVPTANLDYEMAPDIEPGVYTGQAILTESKIFPCVICYGALVLSGKMKCEVHLIGCDEDLYDREIALTILDRVNDLVPFVSHEQMRQKIHADLLKAKQMLGIN